MSRVFIAFSLALAACAVARGEPAQYESFEDGVPAYFTATRAGSLSVSPWHSKHGKTSLRWEWTKGEELVVRHGIGDVARVGGFLNRASFVVWVYSEKAIDDALTFAFREGDKVTGSFRFPLKFTGWRQARLHYDEFPQGRPTSAVDNIRIVAPSSVAKGTVYLDVIRYNTLSYMSVSINPEEVAQRRRPVPDERRFPKPQRVTEEQLAGIRKLQGNPVEKRPGVPEAQVDKLCEQVNALGIVRDEHGVRGPCLDARHYFVANPGQYGGKDVKYWPDEYGPDGLAFQSPGPLVGLASQVAGAYRASNEDQQRRRLAEAFLLIADHLQDQGESLETHAVFPMREVLAQAGRLEYHLDALLTAAGGGAYYVDEGAEVRSNMDFYSYAVDRLLNLCFFQVDPAEQVRWLNAWKAALERSILQPTSSLKIDGSPFHHHGHYHSYAQGAFGNFTQLLKKMIDTPWRVCPEAHERYRRAMLAQRLYCNQLAKPLSLAGRSPYAPGYGGILPYGVEALGVLACIGTPDGKQEVDPEVAAAYLRLAPKAVEKEPYSRLGIKPEPDPSGTFVMPYGALICHRRDNWLVCVKGQSKYVWGSERQAQRNAYGLFQGLGNMEILAGGSPVNAKDSGYDPLGWDWRRFEGTTAPQLPLKEIDEGWGAVSMTVHSPETFANGLSHQGRQGVFGMMLHQAIAPKNKTLKGRKSWFFGDDKVLCLGSDISCDEARYPTQTILCQKHLSKNDKGELPATCLDGADFTGLPAERTLDEAKSHWFLDIQQTGYYLPAGQKAVVARKRQTTRDVDDLIDTDGDFLTAWIDHGKAPSAASYEYVAVIRATPDAMQRLAAQPPYRVVQRDQAAHIVWDTASRRWGCVLFVPQEVAAHAVAAETLPVKAVDRPCLVMAEAVRDGRLDLSAADPDLNWEKDVSQPRPLRITLRGSWRLVSAKGTVCAWPLLEASQRVRVVSSNATETVLEIICHHGASYDIRLAR